jgi:hypothetical protein
MASEGNRDRKVLYRDVEYGRLSPAEAEGRLRQLGLKPFESRPDPSHFDPMTEAEWTLPMAAAWFIWRSLDAVRDQWNPARQGWQKWVPCAPPPRPKGLIVPRKSEPQPSLMLKGFRRATLAEVFSQARLPGASTWDTSPAYTHSPYGRLREALGSGQLQATRGKSSSGHAEKILREYWQRQFDADATGRKQQILHPSKSTRLMVPHKKLTSVKAEEHESNTHSEEHSEKIKEEIDAIIEMDRDDYERWKTEYDSSVVEMNELFLNKDDIFGVEKSLSEQEYKGIDWDVGQALGWIAYQKQGAFRSLWETDLNPRPTYYGEAYSPDFVTSDPVGALKEELLSATLIGYQDGEAILSTRWIGSEVWDRPHMKFMRADVIKIWKELPLAAPPKKPRPSKEKMTEIHEGLNAERGSQPSEQDFRDKLEERGFDSNVRNVRKFRTKYAAEKGIRFEPGPRGKHKPRPDPTQCPGES